MENITADRLTDAHKGRTFIHAGNEYVMNNVAVMEGGWQAHIQVTLNVTQDGKQAQLVARADDPVQLL
ncbi:hypothetical protein RCF19_28725 [Rhodococcus qingshengii]